jgi:hypothetical protein
MADVPQPDDDAELVRASRTEQWKARLLRLERAVNRGTASPRVRSSFLGFAMVAFIALTVISFVALPNNTSFRWWLLPILAFVMAPLTVLINTAEFRTIGLINNHRLPWFSSMRLTIIAAASNLLPLPGGIVIRTQALRQRGSSYKHALGANAAAGIAWIGTGCLAVGLLFLGNSDRHIASAILIALGCVCVWVVWRGLKRANPTHALRLLLRLFLIEALTVLVSAVRLFLAIRFIGQSMTAVQAVAVSSSAIISAAVGIFPSGLGLREALAGGIGSAVGLTVAASIAASAADRITSELGLACMAGAILVIERRVRRRHGLDNTVAATDESDQSSTMSSGA